MNINTPLGRLRLLALLEGISYLLLAITMPLKYWYEMPIPNFVVGMAHGWLFIMYVIISFQNIYLHRWDFKRSMIVLAASLVPFGTFIVDSKILKPFQQGQLET